MTRPRQARTRTELHAADSVRQARRSIASDLREARLDAGLSLRHLAAGAGVSASTVRALEQSDVEPTLQVLARIAVALGLTLGVRLYPGTGPLIRDHIQSAILDALLGILHTRWRPSPEVAVYRPVRGVIDLVLDEAREHITVACEAQSELRRLEQQLRWSHAKADALGMARQKHDDPTSAPRIGRLLLLRSTARTRAAVAELAGLVQAAYPARAADAYAALTGDAPWPGDAIVWCRVEGRQARILNAPPRGIPVGR